MQIRNAKKRERPLKNVRSISSRSKSIDIVFIALTSALVILSLLTGPRFPTSDSAFFEYVGKSLLGGRHLYTELWDNKLPSIYLLNASYWAAFGGNYFKHLEIETFIALCTIVLFALILRRLNVRSWTSITCVFSIFYLFVGGPPNQAEHYATPLILAGVLLSTYGRYILSAVLLVLASTFWIPAIVAAGIAILVEAPVRSRINFIAAALVAGLGLGAVFIFFYGIPTGVELLQSWVSYEIDNYQHKNYIPVHHKYPLAQLSPSYYVKTGFGVLLALAATMWVRKNTNENLRFVTAWAVTTLLIVLAMGKASPHYFLPLYPALLAFVAIQPVTRRSITERWPLAIVTATFAAATLFFTLRAEHPDRQLTTAMYYTGSIIRTNYGIHAIAMLPWELYLTSDAIPPGRFFMSRVVRFAEERDTWRVRPTVFVDARDLHFNRIPPPAYLNIECSNSKTLPYLIFVKHPIPGLTCRAV